MSAPASASYPAGEFDCDGDDFSDSGSSSVTSSSTSKPLGAKAYLTDCRFGSRCNRGEQCGFRHASGVGPHTPVCPGWLKGRRCGQVDCPHAHPSLPKTTAGAAHPHSHDGPTRHAHQQVVVHPTRGHASSAAHSQSLVATPQQKAHERQVRALASQVVALREQTKERAVERRFEALERRHERERDRSEVLALVLRAETHAEKAVTALGERLHGEAQQEARFTALQRASDLAEARQRGELDQVRNRLELQSAQSALEGQLAGLRGQVQATHAKAEAADGAAKAAAGVAAAAAAAPRYVLGGGYWNGGRYFYY